MSTAGVNGNCRFRDIGGVRRRNVACCSIGPHGSDLTFISVVGFGTAGSCFAVVFVATYVFFPAPRIEVQKEAGKKQKRKATVNNNEGN
jgi:hypothetical protein